jgi:hypothetical protein
MVIFLPELANCSAISRREHVKCYCDNVDDVRFVLDQYGQLDFDSASSLNHQSAPLRALKQSDTINQGK